MNKEPTEEDLEFKSIPTRNNVFSPAPTLNKENFKYVFERWLLHILQHKRRQGQTQAH